MIRKNFYLTEKQDKELKERAEEGEHPMSWHIREALDNYLNIDSNRITVQGKDSND